MLISGLTPLTLVDFPGKIACIVFTQGCNFRCSFCHNPDLVQILKKADNSEKFFNFLESRKSLLDGVVITGGEPTLQKDIVKFIQKIKAMGFSIKLDTNGSNPDILDEILQQSLVDYVAMDIKHIWTEYYKLTQVKVDISKLKKSVELIINSEIDYEFRTTVVPNRHNSEDFVEIGKQIYGAKKYFLQEFRTGVTLKPVIGYKSLDLNKIQQIVSPLVQKVSIRR